MKTRRGILIATVVCSALFAAEMRADVNKGVISMKPSRRLTGVLAGLLLMPRPSAGAADGAVRLSTQTAEGETHTLELKPGQIAVGVSGPRGRQVFIKTPEATQFIVQLRGTPLGAQQRAAGRLRSAAALQSVVGAAQALDQQHARVRQAIGDIAARGSSLRAASDPPVDIRHEYKNAFNGLALTAPAWLIEELRRHPDVVDVSPAATMQVDLAQSVPLIGAAELHAQGLTGRNVRVGIIDSGIDYQHPDLGGGFGPGFKVVGGYDFVNDDADPMDDNRHGTHVAGIVAANGTVKGVAPDAQLFAYKVMDRFGSGWTADIIAGIDTSVNPDGDPTTDDALDIINMSLGSSTTPDDPVALATDGAAAAGVLPVCSAGNRAMYWSVGGPGAARRALTVGSANKSDRISPTSSRGPSETLFGIKPDVLAPGVSITSTLPGGRTGPLSGTSMAAPHVTGAAALLLEARPDLTPDDLKSVFMTTARDVGLDLYTQGAGRIDVPAALRRTTLVVPAAVSFGLIDSSRPAFTATARVTVTNDGTAARTYAASEAMGLPAGSSVVVSPSSLELAPGASGTFTFDLSVDVARVPDPTSEHMAHVGRVRIASADEVIQVPVAFLKGASLRFQFDRRPISVTLRNTATGTVWSRNLLGPMVVPAGTYDIYVLFLQSTPSGQHFSLVLRPGVVAQSDAALDIRSTEAVHAVTLAPRDEHGQVVAPQGLRAVLTRAEGFGLDLSLFGLRGNATFAFSPLDPAQRVDWLVTAQRSPDKTYSFFWHRAGIQASETLSNDPSELTTLDFRLDADPATPTIDVVHGNTIVAPGSVEGIGTRVTLPPPFTWKRVVMRRPADQAIFGFVDNEVLTAPPGDTTATQSTYATPLFAVSEEGTAAYGYHRAGRLMPKLLYRTARKSFDLGLEPYAFGAKFANKTDAIQLEPALGLGMRLFVDQHLVHRKAEALPYELRQDGTVVASGMLPGDRYTNPPLPVAPGRYTLAIQGPVGSLGGQPTATTVKATFNTTTADPNPPVVTHVRILADGSPSKAFCIGERAEVRFRATDDVALRHARLKLRIGPQGSWLPLPVQAEGGEFVARLPLGFGHRPDLCAGAGGTPRAVPISARIEAVDTQGNVLVTELTPAYARLLPESSAAPLGVETP
jgi:subtilisin family serine protease